MFFILSKILAFLSHPFYWIVILFLISWFTKRERLKKWTFRIGLGAAVFFTNTVIFCECVRLWEPTGKRIEDVGHYDVAIVLGGMAEYDNSLDRLSIRRSGDRIWQTITLYKLGKVDKILVSGAHGDLIDRGLREAVQMKEVLVMQGIPEEDILVDSLSKNTHENAVESIKILKQHPELQSVLLVTSALHMPRSEACFKKSGLQEFDTFTTDHYTGEERGYHLDQWFMPNEGILSDWSRVIHEWFGYVSYAIAGYI